MPDTFTIDSRIIQPQHVKAIGPAIWVHLWCCREFQHCRFEMRTYDEIAGELGMSKPTVWRHVKRLKDGGYIGFFSTTGHGVRFYPIADVW